MQVKGKECSCECLRNKLKKASRAVVDLDFQLGDPCRASDEHVLKNRVMLETAEIPQ